MVEKHVIEFEFINSVPVEGLKAWTMILPMPVEAWNKIDQKEFMDRMVQSAEKHLREMGVIK